LDSEEVVRAATTCKLWAELAASTAPYAAVTGKELFSLRVEDKNRYRAARALVLDSTLLKNTSLLGYWDSETQANNKREELASFFGRQTRLTRLSYRGPAVDVLPLIKASPELRALSTERLHLDALRCCPQQLCELRFENLSTGAGQLQYAGAPRHEQKLDVSEMYGALQALRELKRIELPQCVRMAKDDTYVALDLSRLLPSWPQLTELSLRNVHELPPLGQLAPALRTLCIEPAGHRCLQLDGLAGLSQLVSLKVSNCPPPGNVKVAGLNESVAASLPSLSELSVCSDLVWEPPLVSALPALPALQSLLIYGAVSASQKAHQDVAKAARALLPRLRRLRVVLTSLSPFLPPIPQGLVRPRGQAALPEGRRMLRARTKVGGMIEHLHLCLHAPLSEPEAEQLARTFPNLNSLTLRLRTDRTDFHNGVRTLLSRLTRLERADVGISSRAPSSAQRAGACGKLAVAGAVAGLLQLPRLKHITVDVRRLFGCWPGPLEPLVDLLVHLKHASERPDHPIRSVTIALPWWRALVTPPEAEPLRGVLMDVAEQLLSSGRVDCRILDRRSYRDNCELDELSFGPDD